MTTTPAWLAILLTLLACITRLALLDHPATPVYDETHVGRFLGWYSSGEFFFDVHPPLSKLLMFWCARALGYRGAASCPYESTEPFAAACDLAPQRLVPALCGAAMVPLALSSAAAMGLHPLAAAAAAWLVLVDTLWLGVSRIHLNDMPQMLFIALTHHLALHSCRLTAAAAAKDADAAPAVTLRDALLLLATGLALGGALQCKYAMALTTLGWLGLQNLLVLASIAAARRPRRVRTLLAQAATRGILLLGTPIALHLALLRVHLAYLPRSGNGDNYLSRAFQATLDGNAHAARVAVDARPGFLATAAEHLAAQVHYNRNMAVLFPRGSHAFDSPWHTWPLAWRGVYFGLVKDWRAVAAAPGGRHLLGFLLHPNPAIALGTAAAAALCAVAVLASAARAAWRRQLGVRWVADHFAPGRTGSLLGAFLLHWLPYATQARQTFILYYLPAYYFAILLAARGWHLVVCERLRPPAAAALTAALCAVAAAVSWRTAALAVGAPATVDEWERALRLASTECWFGRPCPFRPAAANCTAE